MIIRLLMAALICVTSVCYSQENKFTTLILIRHAEKEKDGSKDPVLSVEGLQRSERLCKFFDKTKIDAVYSTSYNRTKQTVAPIAKVKNVPVSLYSVDPLLTYVDKILEVNQGKTILICGHSNTIPGIVNKFLGDKTIEDFADADYANIIILVIDKEKNATFTWLTP
jgi:2,3-bisphosphoglycerate-dependent phosphoglycerate mutase